MGLFENLSRGLRQGLSKVQSVNSTSSKTLIAEKSQKPSDGNDHVFDYLKYYLGLSHAPKYAVLVNGAWGIGKTFLVKKLLKELYPDPINYVCLSLYGLSTTDEIDAALFQALYPGLENRGVKIAGKAIKAGLKYLRVDSDVKIGDLLSRSIGNIYVFDDLERCEMPIGKALGYINEFVEHDDCKVIIIANEKEILSSKDSDAYTKKREKVIGKSLEVQSALNEALESFIQEIDDRATKKLFESRSSEIRSLYNGSTLNNLRILQQTMWDFERVYRSLPEKYQQNSEAVLVLLRLFFALSIELKAGRIGPADLTSRFSQIFGRLVKRDAGESASPIADANSRYLEVELNDSILSDEVLVDILVRGIVRIQAVIDCLDQSRYFLSKASEPAWRAVWHAYERDDGDTAEAVQKLEEQFSDRRITVIGEVLHVFGLRLWLASMNVLNKTRAGIVVECKEYVDDLYALKKLEPLPIGDSFDETRFDGFGGLGIHESETPEYKELFDHLRAGRQRATDALLPEKGEKLLAEMVSDVELFYRRINLTNSKENTYYRFPILASIDPKNFVNSLLTIPPDHQNMVMRALKVRYDHGILDRDLSAEREWLTKVRDALESVAEKSSPIRKYRLCRNIEWYLNPVLLSKPT